MNRQPRVAVVVPVFNRAALTVRFLESFRKIDYREHTVVICDDGSTDGTAEVVAARFPEAVVLKGDGNLWWSGGTNLGVEWAIEHDYDYVLTINNDVTVAADFLDRLVEAAQAHPRRIVGSLIRHLEVPDRVWAAGGFVHWGLSWMDESLFHLHWSGADYRHVHAAEVDPKPVELLTGCGTLVPTACFREVGLYDARWCPQYHGDSEFILRARKAGYEAVVALKAYVWNDVKHGSVVTSLLSRRSATFWKPHLVLFRRYAPWPNPTRRFVTSTARGISRRIVRGGRRRAIGVVKACLRPVWRLTSPLRAPIVRRLNAVIDARVEARIAQVQQPNQDDARRAA